MQLISPPFPTRSPAPRVKVEAQVLAGRKLMEGAADAQAGGAGWSTHAPVCSGQAYFVTDGRPCNLQAFADGVLDGLGTRRRLALPGLTSFVWWTVTNAVGTAS